MNAASNYRGRIRKYILYIRHTEFLGELYIFSLYTLHSTHTLANFTPPARYIHVGCRHVAKRRMDGRHVVRTELLKEAHT